MTETGWLEFCRGLAKESERTVGPPSFSFRYPSPIPHARDGPGYDRHGALPRRSRLSGAQTSCLGRGAGRKPENWGLRLDGCAQTAWKQLFKSSLA